MVGWHHWLNGHGFGWTLGVGDGQGGLTFTGCQRVRHDWATELNWTDKQVSDMAFYKETKRGKKNWGMTLNFILLQVCYYTNLKIVTGEGNGNPLQYFCLENPMDGGAWWAAVHGVPKSRTQLSDFTFTFHFHALEKEIATHSSVLAWRIPGMGRPGGLPSMGSHRVGHWSDLAKIVIILKWFSPDG